MYSSFLSKRIHINFRYHSAPASEPVVRIYDIINSEYLEVVDNDRRQGHFSDNDKESEENDESPANSTHTMHEYEEIA